ncbi:MAG: TlyA family RNA methyltransferase [Desulfuromonadaceae bacterium]|nr:TlyA family RNA methyltransferase [Desulfuromonadaceae bacterium]
MAVAKERLDKLLLLRNLCSSRERARALIMAGQVLVAETVCDKAGTRVALDAAIRLRGADIPYVSRGGVKLEQGLKSFCVEVAGRIAMDVGASTGGFTDCLLQNGARLVYAVDVGYGQLAWSLRENGRVINLERTNIRELDAALLNPLPDLAVIDASFISLEKVLPATLLRLAFPADVIALIKPQFEVGRGKVGKGGVVRDSSLHEAVIAKIQKLAESLNCRVEGLCESPILGPKGNREFLIHLHCECLESVRASARLIEPVVPSSPEVTC